MSQHADEPIMVGTIEVRFLVEPAASAGSVSMFEVRVPGDAKVPAPHSHEAFDETIYGLEGTLTLTVDGAVIELGPGEVVHIPRGVIHGFEALDGDTAMLAVATPGALGPAYFRELGAVLAAAAAAGGPPDRAAMADVMQRHGLTPAAPAT